jgi:hypothetical protein
MPLNHDDATAKIKIDGLAICCFNKKERRWEVGVMRHDEHAFILRWADGHEALAVPADARVVRIETENGETPDYDKEFSEGFFDAGPVGNRKRDAAGLTDDERENFRWAMNLDDGADVPHGTITIKRPPYPVTMVYISDAVFYTNAITPENMFLLPLVEDPNNMSARAVDQRLYGKTADEIGVDIKCSEGGRIKIIVDDKEVGSMEHRPGEPWGMELMNMRKDHNHDRPGHGHMVMAPVAAAAVAVDQSATLYQQGDFQIYYDSLDVTGDKYSLWGKRPPGAASSSSPFGMSGRTDCNTPWVAGDGLSGMTSG